MWRREMIPKPIETAITCYGFVMSYGGLWFAATRVFWDPQSRASVLTAHLQSVSWTWWNSCVFKLLVHPFYLFIIFFYFLISCSAAVSEMYCINQRRGTASEWLFSCLRSLPAELQLNIKGVRRHLEKCTFLCPIKKSFWKRGGRALPGVYNEVRVACNVGSFRASTFVVSREMNRVAPLIFQSAFHSGYKTPRWFC